MASNRELYEQKLQAQLDSWAADIDKLKARASGASADAQIALNEQIDVLEDKYDEGESKLSELSDSSDDAWESMKDGMESAWSSIKTSFSEAADKMRS